jgi:hypothetical protein
MAIQKSTINNLKCALISSISAFIIGAILGGGYMYEYLIEDHFKVHKTNIGLMIFVKDKIYNLSELKSLD